MTIQKEEIEIKNLDHSGIVAGILDNLGSVKKLNGEGIKAEDFQLPTIAIN